MSPSLSYRKPYCKRGHARTPENVGSYGQCKQCVRESYQTKTGFKEKQAKRDLAVYARYLDSDRPIFKKIAEEFGISRTVVDRIVTKLGRVTRPPARVKPDAEQRKLRERNRRAKIKSELFSLLGNICCRCGFPDWRALQVDHINGDGKLDRAVGGSGGTTYGRILNKVKSGSTNYQLLCANCNWIKVHENNERPKYVNRILDKNG